MNEPILLCLGNIALLSTFVTMQFYIYYNLDRLLFRLSFGYRTLGWWTLGQWTLERKTIGRLTLGRQSPKRWTLGRQRENNTHN